MSLRRIFRTIRYLENLNHLFRYSRSAGCFTCVGAKSAPCPRRGLRAYSKVLARKADILLSNKLKLRKGLPVTYLRLLATFSSALRNFPKRILHVPRFTGFAIARNDGGSLNRSLHSGINQERIIPFHETYDSITGNR